MGRSVQSGYISVLLNPSAWETLPQRLALCVVDCVLDTYVAAMCLACPSAWYTRYKRS
jgi:hypothetical protein